MKFVRRDSIRFSKLGKNRKKKQKWRAAKGRDNKIRESRKGYPKAPSVGYKKPRKEQGRIEGKIAFRVLNMKDLEKVGKDNVVVVGRVGAKKKMEILKKASDMKLKVVNFGGKNETR